MLTIFGHIVANWTTKEGMGFLGALATSALLSLFTYWIFRMAYWQADVNTARIAMRREHSRPKPRFRPGNGADT
jgi:hypothetical protein